ncbi:hypothetical protein [Chroococcidiopsis sp.]
MRLLALVLPNNVLDRRTLTQNISCRAVVARSPTPIVLSIG